MINPSKSKIAESKPKVFEIKRIPQKNADKENQPTFRIVSEPEYMEILIKKAFKLKERLKP